MMILMMMGCLFGDLLNSEINKVVKLVDGIIECDINLVWELVWDMFKMSWFVKIVLGIYGQKGGLLWMQNYLLNGVNSLVIFRWFLVRGFVFS